MRIYRTCDDFLEFYKPASLRVEFFDSCSRQRNAAWRSKFLCVCWRAFGWLGRSSVAFSHIFHLTLMSDKELIFWIEICRGRAGCFRYLRVINRWYQVNSGLEWFRGFWRFTAAFECLRIKRQCFRLSCRWLSVGFIEDLHRDGGCSASGRTDRRCCSQFRQRALVRQDQAMSTGKFAFRPIRRRLFHERLVVEVRPFLRQQESAFWLPSRPEHVFFLEDSQAKNTIGKSMTTLICYYKSLTKIALGQD
jgi:hypothetical protein